VQTTPDGSPPNNLGFGTSQPAGQKEWPISGNGWYTADKIEPVGASWTV
jgi:hypothetical protein